MSEKTINRTNQIDAVARCAEIGFPVDVLTPTIEVWIAGKNSATPLHAENCAFNHPTSQAVFRMA